MDKNMAVTAIVAGILAVLFYGFPLIRKARKDSASIVLAFNTDIDPRYCCGHVWGLLSADGVSPPKLIRIPFAADKPELLLKPREATIEHIWASILKAGIQPYTLEIKQSGKSKYVYRYEAGNRPVFVYK